MNYAKYILILNLALLSIFANGQYTSPFNNRVVDDSIGEYSFIVSGHFYGDGNNMSHYPVNTLLGNLDWINESNASLLVCLGDLFKDISNDIPNYQASFFDKLEMPLVNSVGNHDLTGSLYQDNFGETAFTFILNQDAHIVLDTERDNGDIMTDQLRLLNDVSAQVQKGVIKNVFIYTHRTIWKEAYSEMDGIFEDNTQSLGGTNFEDEVLPILSTMGNKAGVYLFSGSLGSAPASFFHFYDQDNNVKIIGTAIRGLPRDAMLQVFVNKNGEVTFKPKSLTGQSLQPLEFYDVDFWQDGVGAEPYNWKLSAYYVQLMLTHRYFWYGVLLTVAGFLSIIWLRKRRKKNNFKA